MVTFSLYIFLYIALVIVLVSALFAWTKCKDWSVPLASSALVLLLIDAWVQQMSASYWVALVVLSLLVALLNSKFNAKKHFVLRDYVSLSLFVIGVALLTLSEPLFFGGLCCIYAAVVYVQNNLTSISNRFRHHHALIVTLSSFALIVAFTYTLELKQQTFKQQKLTLISSHIEQLFTQRWQSLRYALVRLNERVNSPQQYIDSRYHTIDAKNYVNQIDAIVAIARVNPTQIEWQIPEKSEFTAKFKSVVKLIERGEKISYLHSGKHKQLTENQLLIVFPVHDSNSHLMILVDQQKLWAPLTKYAASESVWLNVRLALAQPFIQQLQMPDAAKWHDFSATQPNWQLQVTFMPKREINLTLFDSNYVLVLGFACSCLFGLVVYLFLVTRRQSRALKQKIEEREELHAKFITEKNRTEISAEVSALGVWEWDVKSGALVWDSKMHDIYETPQAIQDNLGYAFWQQSVHPEDIRNAEQTIANALDSKSEWNYEFRIITPSKVCKYVKANARPILNEQREVIKLVGGNMDITHERTLEARLLEAKEAAEQANHAKSTFLANMSHEIRTPMNGVIGITELLQTTELTAQQQDYLNMIASSAESLLGLLNNILDISKVESGQLEIERTPFYFAERTGDAIKSFAPLAHSKNISLDFYISPDIPDCVLGDPVRLNQIIFNLVGNAVKFTAKGGVTVEMLRDEQQSAAADTSFTLQIVVSDTGCGISDDEQAKIFEPFKQADSSTTRKYGGSGLGLTIVQQLVALLGGNLELISEKKLGSKFIISLPMLESDECEKHDEAPWQRTKNAFKGLKCLVVDDNEINRRWLKDMMTAWGCKVDLANSGKQAFNLIKHSNKNGNLYDVLLLDNLMPGMTGVELIKELTQQNQTWPSVIMMLSSSIVSSDYSELTALGIDEILTKPVKQSEIFNSILALVDVNQAPDEREPESQQPLAKSLNILVAEDNFVNQKLLKELLESREHNVTIVNDGIEAQYHAKTGAYDLILMDVQMPNMDGLEATKRIRAFEQTSDINNWIIGLTANALKGDKELCLQAGMDLYMTKPINGAKLISIIEKGPVSERLKSNKKLQDAPSDAPLNSGYSASQYYAQIDNTALFDLERGLLSTGNDNALLDDVIALVLSVLPEITSELQEAMENYEEQKFKAGLHKLKGMLGNLANNCVTEIIADLEYSPSGEHGLELSEKMAVTQHLIDKLSNELQNYNEKGN
ncbi:response regulator [Catenovulum sediminis]|uniref:response regulator n=1 Tax=Catenovulum sediminis TaxID=1740262 RepID=UPI00117DD168|nr:response regulator [Catenovulum sediminis]